MKTPPKGPLRSKNVKKFQDGLDSLSTELIDAAHPHFFVSHAVSDKALAKDIKRLLTTGIKGASAYVSSDGDNPAGSYWPVEIRENLMRASGVILLFTPESLERPWLHFEAGAGLILGRPCFIMTLGEVSIEDLKGNPFQDLQWSRIATKADLLSFMKNVAEHKLIDRGLSARSPGFTRAVSQFMGHSRSYAGSSRTHITNGPIRLDSNRSTHSLERETVDLLKDLTGRAVKLFTQDEPLKLLSVNFRLKHELKLVASIDKRPGEIVMPIRRQHVYKRYVFLKLLEMLRPGYVYSTFSTLDFWVKDGGEPTIQKFIEANRALTKGEDALRIHRIVLIDPGVFDIDLKQKRVMHTEPSELWEKAKSLSNVWEQFNVYGINENTLMHTKRHQLGSIDTLLNKLLAKRFMNIFVVRSKEVEQLVKQLGENELPNAYVQGDGKQMVVKVVRAESSAKPSNITISFPKDGKVFGDHRKVFKDLLRIAVRDNADLCNRMDGWK